MKSRRCILNFWWGGSVARSLAFTTSPAMACWASGSPTVSSSRRICRGLTMRRTAQGVAWERTSALLSITSGALGPAIAAHDKRPEGSRLRDTHRQVTVGVIASPGCSGASGARPTRIGLHYGVTRDLSATASRIFAISNQIDRWLRQVERLRRVGLKHAPPVCGRSSFDPYSILRLTK
jgi:hypothetical protein